MSEAYMGARVRYCGYTASFVADIYLVEGANVVRANGPITDRSLDRDRAKYEDATHHLIDAPVAGFWRPELGVFVVPAAQVRTLPCSYCPHDRHAGDCVKGFASGCECNSFQRSLARQFRR